MLDLVKLLINAVVSNPQLGILVVALAGFGVVAFAIYALLVTVRALGRRR